MFEIVFKSFESIRCKLLNDGTFVVGAILENIRGYRIQTRLSGHVYGARTLSLHQ